MSGSLDVAPAAVLLAIYSAMLVYGIALCVLVPALRLTRIFVVIYLVIRLFSFAVWLSIALGNSMTASLFNASFSLFYSGFFLLVGAAYPLFYMWFSAVEAACGEPAAPQASVARLARLLSFVGMILLLVSGSQLAQISLSGTTSITWPGPVGIAGAALLLLVTAIALPYTLAKGTPPLMRARSAALDDSRCADLSRLLSASAVLAVVCLGTSVRGAGAVATAAGAPITQSSLYGLVIGPELPVALVLLAPIGALFAPPQPHAAKGSIGLPLQILPALLQPARLAPAAAAARV